MPTHPREKTYDAKMADTRLSMQAARVAAYRYPLVVAMVYLISTVLMYFGGAYVWDLPNPAKVLLFLALAYAGFWIGGEYGARSSAARRRLRVPRLVIDGRTVFRISCLFSIVAYFVMAKYFGGGLVVRNLALSLGEIYLEKAARVAYDRSAAVQVISWFWGLTYLYLPIGLYLYRRMTLADRLLLFTTTATCVWYWLSIGTVKGIGDIVIQIVAYYALLRTQGRLASAGANASGEDRGHSTRDALQARRARRRTRRYTATTLLVVLLFLYAFDAIQVSRDIALYGVVQSSSYVPSTLVSHVKHVRETPLPDSLEALMFYMSHGYTGLAYSLELPFRWTGMVGFSRALTELVEARLPVRVGSLTYLQRAEDIYGWDNGIVWSTIFPWIAGDVTFYGVPIVMALIGRFFVGVWRSCLRDDGEFNILDLVLFSQMVTLVLFIPANNQIFQSRQALFAIMLLVFGRRFVKVRFPPMPFAHPSPSGA